MAKKRGSKVGMTEVDTGRGEAPANSAYSSVTGEKFDFTNVENGFYHLGN